MFAARNPFDSKLSGKLPISLSQTMRPEKKLAAAKATRSKLQGKERQDYRVSTARQNCQ